MDFQALRNKILDKAIRGELVPQLESELTVAQITKETVDIPFEIPEKWKWARLDQVSNIVRGGSPRPIQHYLTEDSTGINWVKIGDAERGSKVISSCKEKIRPEGIKRSRLIRKGSLLLTNSMSYGYPYILNVDGCIHDGWLAFSDFDDYFDIDFLYFVLLSPFCKTQFTKAAAGAVVKNLNINKVRKILVPVPPIAEQKRITKKLERLFDDIEQAEKVFFDLQNLSNFLRKIILQQAIHGKLVPQLESEPEVETFSDEPDDPPFDIPDKWKWAKLKDVVDVRDGTHDTPKYQISGIPLITSKNLRNGSIDLTNVKYISEADHIEISKRSKVEKGDILFAMIGTIGNPAIVGNDNIFSIKNVALFKPVCDSKLNFEFLYYLLLFAQDQMLKESSGGVQRFVSLKYLRNFYIPIPPLGEQRRIMLRIRKLLSILEAV